MNVKDIIQDISAGLLITDAEFRILWANAFEERFYQKTLKDMIGLWVVDCHKEENKAFIADFLEKFKAGEIKEFTKIAAGMVITYSSYYNSGEFAGIVRTRIYLPENSEK